MANQPKPDTKPTPPVQARTTPMQPAPAVEEPAVPASEPATGPRHARNGGPASAEPAAPVAAPEASLAAETAPVTSPAPDADPVPEADAAQETASAPEIGQAPESEPAQPAMRTPSIREEAVELLNGSKPAARELPRVIAIANQKGGVGKTTTTVNLGAALAEQGYRVLVVDLDPQGNATTGLGVEARNFEYSMYDVIMREQPLEDCIEPTSVKNLFVAPATIDLAGIEIELVPAFSRELKLKRAVDSVVDDFDFILIDCPPSLGLITVNGLAAADEVMVPIQCEYYALEGLSQLLRNVNLVSTNLNEIVGGDHHCAHHVRRPHPPFGRCGQRGPEALLRAGVQGRDPEDGPPVGGTLLRAAHHGVRPGLAGGGGLPRAGQGGEQWRAAADSVRA